METIESVREYKKIVEDLLGIDLGNYFVDDLFQLQEMLIGRGVFDSINSDIVNITRIYLTDIDGNTITTTNLCEKGIGGFSDEMELIEDINNLGSTIRISLANKVIQQDNLDINLNLLNNLYQLIYQAKHNITQIMKEDSLQREEVFVANLVLTLCDELRNHISNTYVRYMTLLT